MLKKILLILTFLVAALLAYAATRPADYTVSRSILIDAPPERVYAIVNDFHNFPRWSPWQHLDPAMQTRYGGPASGVGAVYEWQGNQQVGKGRMEILESVPGRKVGMDLRFIEPFASQSRTDIAIAPEAGGSRVTWSIAGRNNFLMKLISVFVPMDRMMGRDFEAGLANLEREAEAAR